MFECYQQVFHLCFTRYFVHVNLSAYYRASHSQLRSTIVPPLHLFLYNFISKDLWRHANKNANELLHMSSCFMAAPAPGHASFKDTKK